MSMQSQIGKETEQSSSSCIDDPEYPFVVTRHKPWMDADWILIRKIHIPIQPMVDMK